MMNKIIKLIQYKVQHYNPNKYWKYRNKFITTNSKMLKIYYLYKIKKMDAFNNASMGTNFEKSATFVTPPIFPHGIGGIVISQHAKIGKECVIYHQVTIGSKDDKTGPTIKNNVTIYPGAKIIGNITIGNNCIVGANSVVTKSFGDNLVIAGVPAKIIKEIKEEK